MAATAVRQVPWEVQDTLERELPHLAVKPRAGEQRYAPKGGVLYRVETRWTPPRTLIPATDRLTHPFPRRNLPQ